MDQLTTNQLRLDELVRFLCGRSATDEELESAERAEYNYNYFRIQVLAGDECLGRWPSILQAWSHFLAREREMTGSTHKMAHDLSLVRKDLDALQARFDGMQPQILEILRNADLVARLCSSLAEMQAQILSLSSQASAVEAKLSTYLALETL